MRKLIHIILLLLVNISLFAKNDEESFKEANLLYQEEKYDEAIIAYEDLLSKGYVSSDLNYNLGNAYFRNNQIAKAILHYERALKIDPSNEDASHNLGYANSRTIDKIETPPKLFIYRWWESIIHSYSSNSWAYLVILFLFFGVAGLSIFFFFSDSMIKRLSFYSGISTIALALICWFIAESHHDSLLKEDYAIIQSPTVDISSSPSEGSSRLFVLHEGSKVKLEDRSGEWVEVKLPNGSSGWIKSSELEII